MFDKFRKSDEARLAALELKLDAAREAAHKAKEAVAEAALAVEERAGNRQALERAERQRDDADALVLRLELAFQALRKDVAAREDAAAAEARAERERATEAAYEALRGAAGEATLAIDALGGAAATLQRAIDAFAPFATGDDHSNLADLRASLLEMIKKRVRCVTGKPPLVDIESLLRFLPSKKKPK